MNLKKMIWWSGLGGVDFPGTGLFSLFIPSANKITSDASKMVLTDSNYSAKKYRANVANESPTYNAGPPEYLAFDNSNDRLFDSMYPNVLGRVTVPDLPDSTTGKGFTCTGLVYDELRGTFWAGNDGRTVSGDPTYNTSIVELSIDLVTGACVLVQNLDVSAVITGSLQGVAVDTSDNTLWAASLSDNKIYHFDKDGTPLSGTITVGAGEANGLAYDPVNDEFWVCKQSVLKRYNKSGVATVTVSGIVDDLDHLYYDNTAGLVYASWGTNGAGPHRISVYDVTLSRYYKYFYYMNDIVAIEGISIINNKLVVFSDEYFHSVGNDLNQVAVFDIGKNFGDFPIATKFMWCGVYTTPVTVSENGDIVWSIGEPNNDIGISIHFLTQTALRFVVNTASGTAEKTIASIVSTSLGTKSVLTYVLDFAADNMLTYRNGVLIDTESSILPATGIRMTPAIIGNWLASDRPANMNMYGFSIQLNDIASRTDVEAFWTEQAGI